MAFDWKKPTAMMLGRFQPFHDGHKKLFKEILKRTGQVAILIRDVADIDESNPFDFEVVKANIDETLASYHEVYEILLVPNITNICYGRKVGYNFEKITLPDDVEAISATAIRADMKETGQL